MTRRRQVLLWVAAAAVVALVVAVLAGGFLGNLLNREAGDPPCDSLPRRTEVQTAVDRHSALVDRLEAVGAGVSVDVTSPCPDASVGLIVVRVTSDEQRSAVRKLLEDGTGFGVPVVVHRV